MTNVPADLYDEDSWQELVSRSSGLRSIFQPTDTFSLVVFAGKQGVAKPFDSIPYRDIVLRDFVVPGLARDPNPFSLFLTLTGKTSDARDLHALTLPVRWKSRYRRANGDIVFLYRPDKIKVVIPIHPVDGVVDKSTRQTSSGPSHLTPIDQVVRNPKAVLDRFTGPRTLRSKSGKPVRPKNGFAGVPKARPNPSVQSYTGSTILFPANGAAPFSLGDYSVQTYYRSFAGATTPGFRTLPKGKLPVNNYELTIVRTEDFASSDYLTYPPNTSGLTTQRVYSGRSSELFFTTPPLPSHNSAVRNKAISNLLKKAEEDISANLAQDFAQYGQTTRLIAGNATRIYNAVRAVKRGDVTTALKHLGASTRTKVEHDTKGKSVSKSTADIWLEMQYGWKPLLKDIDDLMRILNQSIVKKPAIVTLRSGSHKEEKVTLVSNLLPGKEGPNIDCNIFYSTRVGVRYSHNSDLVNYLQQTGFTNPINLAWEILPYSFVADWFIPIGPYLETLSAWQSKTFIGGFISQFTREEDTCRFDITSDPFNGGYVRRIKGGYTRTVIKHSRDNLVTFPRLSLPKPKNPISTTHALNAIALVRSAFAK